MEEKRIIFEEVLHHYIDVKVEPGESAEDAFEKLADEQMDLFSDGEVIESGITQIDDKRISPSVIDYEKAVSALIAYVEDDVEASELSYVRDKLETVCGLSEDDCRVLGLDWIFED